MNKDDFDPAGALPGNRRQFMGQALSLIHI